MTERLYYTDAYTTQFEAHIVERIPYPDGQHVGLILDRTYFYPTSGGQPHDTGRIHNLPVIDVYLREEDNAIVHLVEGDVWQEIVRGEISWVRRFEHMQQHTGQHILTTTFINKVAADTVSFHMGKDTATIDLDQPDLTPEQIGQVEWAANQIVWENRPVRVFMVSRTEAEDMLLRKFPPDLSGRVRLIDITEYDLTACGGTHVAHTGEVGIIKIVALEKLRKQMRVHFVCGQRALRDYRNKNRTLNRLATSFTTGYDALEHVTNRLREDNKQAIKDIKKLKAQLRRYEAEEMLEETKPIKKVKIVRRVFTDMEVNDMRSLAVELASRPGVVALLGLAGARSFLVFGRSHNVPGDMNKVIKPALQLLGTTAGGGTSELAQGGGPPADENRVSQALTHAERLITGLLT